MVCLQPEAQARITPSLALGLVTEVREDRAMGPFFPPNPWVQQQLQQAMGSFQIAAQHEAMGNLVGAGPFYDQAARGLSACVQMLGPATPDPIFYYLGCCQVRLGFLTHASGNAAWAQEWLRHALGSFQAAWQRNPGHPAYQLAVGQLSLALGQVQQAQVLAQQMTGNPQQAAFGQMVNYVSQAGAAPPTQASGAASNVKGWLETGGKALDVLAQLMKLFNVSGGDGGSAMHGGFNLGMGMGGNPWGM
jgi:hypothetical protein